MDAAACLRADFAPGNVPKGVAWSPDGTCLLTATEDARVRLYEVPGAVLDGGAPPSRDWAETFACAEGEAVYDYKWYPQMHSDDPISCCLASSRRASPRTSGTRSRAPAAAPTSGGTTSTRTRPRTASRSPSGAAPLRRRPLSVFDTGRCGSDCDARPTAATRRAKSGVKGLLGALACRDEAVTRTSPWAASRPWRSTAAAASSRRAATSEIGPASGLRPPRGRVAVRCRRGATPSHQRLGFDLREDRLLAGGADGRVFVFDVAPGSSSTDAAADAPVVAELPRAPDCCNGAAFHPHRPLVALASGQRHYADPGSSSDDTAPRGPPAVRAGRRGPAMARRQSPP
ncbi:hypothetical protein JL722_4446 [Aureococcus anophagefferens]|nr:hypothetical protein JL722_4446 [Aureococcus anophagefferens]